MSSANVEMVATASLSCEAATKAAPPSQNPEEDAAPPPPAAFATPPATPPGDSPPAGAADARGDADDPAWRLMSAFLKGWFLIWVLFAILVILADALAPRRPHKSTVEVTAEDAQLLLEVSEAVVAACAYSRLDTAGGRDGCRALCRDHMCCFAGSDAWGAPRGAYGCAEDAGKMCPAHAGCEALVVSEDEAVIFDADGVAVFGDEAGSSGDSTSAGATAAPPEQHPPYSAVTEATSSTELELIRRVVEAVCADDRLRSHHGLRECAALCAPSLCCFDRGDVELRNPTLHLMLKLEAAPVDLAALGTCVDEGEGEDAAPRHFCRAHAGCEHLLLFGAEGEPGGRHGEAGDAQRRMFVTVGVLFGALIGVTAYLLVCQRHAADRVDWRKETSDDAEDDASFAPVGVCA